MIPPAVPFLSSDIPPFSWQMLASGSVFNKKNKKKQNSVKVHCM